MLSVLVIVLAVAPADVAISEPSAHLFTEKEAPLQPGSAVMTSMATVATGFVLMTAATIRLATQTPGAATNYSMFSLGFLLFNFGPNMADFASGNFRHGLERGLLRIGLLIGTALLTLAGPIGAIGVLTAFSTWIAWVIGDVVDSARANQRWARRMNDEPPLPLFPLFSFR